MSNFVLFVLGNGLMMGVAAIVLRFPPWFTIVATVCINLIVYKTVFCP